MRALFSILVTIFGLIPTHSALAADANWAKVDKLMDDVLQKHELYPSKWPSELTATSIDLNERIGTEFKSGTAYAATVATTIPVPLATIRKLFVKEHGLLNVVTRIKTLRNFRNIEEKLTDKMTQVNLNLAVKVPVLADYETQENIRVYEISATKGVLDARQTGGDGDLEYNRSYTILEADGEKTRAFVIGVHIIKMDRKVPWIGRGTATSFAKEHYSNYILALNDSLKSNNQ